MKKSGLFCILLLLFGLSSHAQYNISGSVKDKSSGQTLPGASVSIENTTISTTSSDKGTFIISAMKPGHYRLKISYMGYSTHSMDIEVKGDTRIEVLLEEGSILSQEVVINGTRVPVNAPSTLTYVSKEEIASVNTGQDLPFILSGIPSAVITSDAGTGIGYTGIRIRGTDMTRINVTVNGVPYNDPESHEVYWVDLPDIASSIENIEIQRGVGTSSNGAASFGGSINIQTEKSRQFPYAELDASAGSFNSFRSAVSLGSGLLKNKFSVDGRLSFITSDGYIDRASSDLKSFFVSASWFGKKAMLKTNVFSGKERTYQAWDGIPGEILDTNRTFNVNGLYYDSLGNRQFYKDEVDDYRQDHYQILYSRQFDRDFTLNAVLHYTHGEGYYEQYKQDKEAADYGLIQVPGSAEITDLIVRKWMKNDFFGVVWSLSQQRTRLQWTLGGAWNRYLGDHFGRIIWSKDDYLQPTTDYQWYFNNGTKQDGNIYGKLYWIMNNKLSFLADLQYRNIDYQIDGNDEYQRNLIQSHSYNFVNPKAGATLVLSEHQKIQFYSGIANREPKRSNFKDADPGKIPQPERLLNFELGYYLQIKPLKLTVNLYYMDYKDQLVLTGKINSVGAPVMVNVPQSYREGIELITDLAVTSWLQWAGNLTLSRNKIRNFTAYIDNWDEGGQVEATYHNTDLPFSPATTFNSNIQVIPLKNLALNWINKYVSAQYIDNTGSEERMLDSYFINDLRVTYKMYQYMFRQLSFTLQLNNIFSEKYESNAWVYRYYANGQFNKMDGYFPQAGRNFMLGLQIKF